MTKQGNAEQYYLKLIEQENKDSTYLQVIKQSNEGRGENVQVIGNGKSNFPKAAGSGRFETTKHCERNVINIIYAINDNYILSIS